MPRGRIQPAQLALILRLMFRLQPQLTTEQRRAEKRHWQNQTADAADAQIRHLNRMLGWDQQTSPPSPQQLTLIGRLEFEVLAADDSRSREQDLPTFSAADERIKELLALKRLRRGSEQTSGLADSS